MHKTDTAKTYTIRPFQAGVDKPAVIARLHLEVRRWQEEHQKNIFTDIYDSQADLNAIDEFYLKPGGNFFVAYEPATGRVAGFVGLKNEGQETGRIMRLAVMEKYRRQGIGLSLVNTAVDWARDNDFKLLRLGTGFREKARPVYEKAGFKVIGTKNGKDYLMEYDLTEKHIS